MTTALVVEAHWRCPKCGCHNPSESGVTEARQRWGRVRKCTKPGCGKNVAVMVQTTTRATHDVAISDLAWEGA